MPELNYTETRKAFLEKYSDILNIIAKAEGVDPDTAIDMFKSNVLYGACYGWKEARQDLSNLDEVAKEELGVN
jgi:hypothetical protein